MTLGCFTTAEAGSHGGCAVKGITMDNDGVLYASRDGYYAGVHSESVVKKKTPIPTVMVEAGFGTVDGYSYDEKNKVSYFTKGPYFLGVGEGDKITTKKTAFETFSAALAKEMPKGADAFAFHADGTMYFAKDGNYWGFNDKGSNTVKKTAFPAVLKNNGFDSVDSMDIAPNGDFYFTKGPYVIGIGAGEKVVYPKSCLPSELTTQGFYAVDGMSHTSDGTTYLVKGGHYMAMKGGAVKQAKAKFPPLFADNGFDTIDSMAKASDGTIYVTKGDQYMGVKDDKVTVAKQQFGKKFIAEGFMKADGLSFYTDTDKKEVACVLNGENYMCTKGEEVVQAKKKLPKVLMDNGMTPVDGFHIGGDGKYAVTKDGYYVVGIGEGLTVQKTPLPSSLTKELCGVATCVGPADSKGKLTTLGASTSVSGGSSGSSTSNKATSKTALPHSLFAMPMLLMLGVASLL